MNCYKSNIIYTGIFCVVFLPSFFMMILHASSLALGLLISIAPILMYSFFCFLKDFKLLKPQWNAIRLLVVVTVFIFVHYLIVTFVIGMDTDFNRFFIGWVGLNFLIFSSVCYSLILKNVSDGVFNKIIFYVCFLFFINSLISLSGVDFFGGATAKPIFLFSEPSHFALAVAPFFIYYVKSRQPYWLIGLIYFFGWAIYIQNLTMLIVLLLAIGCSFKIAKLSLFFMLAFFALFFSDVDYFLSRIQLSADNDNLSTLVFLQGWQNAFLTLKDSMGFGSGFQQFGVASSKGVITEKISILYDGGALNLMDGGTTASKLIGEFGVLGVVVVFFVLWQAFISLNKLQEHKYFSGVLLFMHCIAIAFLVEFFVRGVGYFSSGVFMYFLSLFYLRWNKSNGVVL